MSDAMVMRYSGWTFVEHIRADYEPTDDPSWEEVAQDLRGGRDMMTQSNWKQYNRSGSRNPDAYRSGPDEFRFPSRSDAGTNRLIRPRCSRL
jgi:hypothetical protein